MLKLKLQITDSQIQRGQILFGDWHHGALQCHISLVRSHLSNHIQRFNWTLPPWKVSQCQSSQNAKSEGDADSVQKYDFWNWTLWYDKGQVS